MQINIRFSSCYHAPYYTQNVVTMSDKQYLFDIHHFYRYPILNQYTLQSHLHRKIEIAAAYFTTYYSDISTQINSKTLQAVQYSMIMNAKRKMSAPSVFIHSLPSMTAHPIVLQSHIIIFTTNIKLLHLPSNTKLCAFHMIINIFRDHASLIINQLFEAGCY